MSEVQRDHVFISYATEDMALSEWLTYKLTTLGYKVWCDRVKLFGGESYPQDIDYAIKNRTIRFLALLSHASLNKPNPLKERTTALNIAEVRKEKGFIIPLNLGITKTEVPWQLADITWVPFQTNWAEGLLALLKTLRKSKTPCPLQNGRDMVSDSILSEDIIIDKREIIYSNFLKIKIIPDAITEVVFNHKPTDEKWRQLRQSWAAHRVDARTFLSFQKPPTDVSYRIQNAYLWNSENTIHGMDAHDLVSELLKKNLFVVCCKKGLVWSKDYKWLYFPFDPKGTNRISFVDSLGRNNNIQVAGERKFFSPGRTSRYRYYLAPTFKIMRKMFREQFIVKLGLRIRITNTIGRSILLRSAQSRRKHVSKDWWNYEWVSRYIAICSFLSNGTEEIIVGDHKSYRVTFSAKPLSYVSPISFDEAEIDMRRKNRQSLD